jgi:exodeoxyribonuclease VII large subunit
MTDSFSELFPASALSGVLPTRKPARVNERRQIWTIGKLLAAIREQIERKTGRIWLAGEISNLSSPVSGHKYFTLKEKSCEIKAVLFRKKGCPGVTPEDGQKVICFGRPDIYTARGDLQFIVERIELQGKGDISADFEKLKRKLEEEGLFDSRLKRAIPVMPERVFIITSPSGAAVQDFIKTSGTNRYGTEIVIVPSSVQGSDAPGQLCAALSRASSMAGPNDVIVLARGGGSMEDLNAFNDETLARMIRGVNAPVISAVGHETDFTIADFTADLRAPTPTAAASILFQKQAELANRAMELKNRLERAGDNLVAGHKHRLERTFLKLHSPDRKIVRLRLVNDDLARRLAACMNNRTGHLKTKVAACLSSITAHHPLTAINHLRLGFNDAEARMTGATKLFIEKRSRHFAIVAERLNAASPLTHLAQGYSLVIREADRTVVRSARDVRKNDLIKITTGNGAIRARVTETGIT